MTFSIKWAEAKIPPINLWTVPKQIGLYSDWYSQKIHESAHRLKADHFEKRAATMAFIYYCRTGRFPDDEE